MRRRKFLLGLLFRDKFGERLGVRPAVLPVTIAGQELKLGGDIVIEVMGIPIGDGLQNGDQIRDAMLALPPNSIVRVKVLRAGEIIELVATSGR